MPRASTTPKPPQSRRILPIAERLHAETGYAGRGITVAFIDSGFHAHPDLTSGRDRVVAYHDIHAPGAGREALSQSDASAWHGMMTSVVACGNGALSGGRYRGLAWES